MGTSEKKNKGNERESTLEDGLEALIGAIFLDGGMSAAKDRVLSWLGEFNSQLDHSHIKFNPKGRLQELVQANRPNDKIRYKLIKESGPPHDKTFRMRVTIGESEFGEGEGRSKKEAEEKAAEEVAAEGEQKVAKETPEVDTFMTTYFEFPGTFTTNLMKSRRFLQVGLGVSTQYDDTVMGNVEAHQLALRSEILNSMSEFSEEEIQGKVGREALAKALTESINAKLIALEGFGGVGEVHFTSFVLQ